MRKLFLFLALAASAAGAEIPPTVLDVTDFGAQGNGSADDTNAVNNALNACGPGDAVYFPAGTYSGNFVFDDTCKEIFADQDTAILRGRNNTNFATLYNPGSSNDQYIHGLIIENGSAEVGLKFDGSPVRLRVQFNRFRNGSVGLQTPAGFGQDSTWSTIDHNIFEGLGLGIDSNGKMFNTHVDSNYFTDFSQGISAGGCSDAPIGNNTTFDHNTFIRGMRMAIELCGTWHNISASHNYLTERRPEPNPDPCRPEPFDFLFPEYSCFDPPGVGKLCGQDPPFCERYEVCGSSFPYKCDSMGISIATGCEGLCHMDFNKIYRQTGTSWGIEYTVVGPNHSANGNEIWGAGIAIAISGSCNEENYPGNCNVIRPDITNNSVCGNHKGDQSGDIAGWGAGNSYSLTCPGTMPAQTPVPDPPFGTGISNCTITPATVGTFTVGQTAAMTFTANGCGSGTLTWTSSGLPNGRSGCNLVSGNSCNITGTYSAAGNFSPSISVTDGGSNSASVNPSIQVLSAPSVTTVGPLPNGTTGSAYSATLSTTGGLAPVTCSLTGALPTFRVNAGGSSFTDGSGAVWAADSGFSVGSRTFSDSTPIGGTTDDPLYQSGRVDDSGTLTYAATVPNGTYNVTLKFVEQFQFGAGLRVMDVTVEGSLELDNYDIFAGAGAFTAKDEVIMGVVVSDGTLNISFVASADLPVVSAIQIAPVSGGGEITGSGLTVNSGCTITGTGVVAGTYNFGVTPTDANGVAGASRSLQITLVAPVPNTGTVLQGATVTGVSVQ